MLKLAFPSPSVDQRLWYNGKDRQHGLKYQGVMAPDGLFLQVWGPFQGRRHDAALLHESGLLDLLRTRFSAYGLYGDPAYPLSSVLIRPFRGAKVLTEAEKAFNTSMSSVRESVEWGFGMITNMFQSLLFTRKQKLLESPLEQSYQVSAFLLNCRTCLRDGNQVSKYFSLKPPSLSEYLRKQVHE